MIMNCIAWGKGRLETWVLCDLCSNWMHEKYEAHNHFDDQLSRIIFVIHCLFTPVITVL